MLKEHRKESNNCGVFLCLYLFIFPFLLQWTEKPLGVWHLNKSRIFLNWDLKLIIEFGLKMTKLLNYGNFVFTDAWKARPSWSTAKLIRTENITRTYMTQLHLYTLRLSGKSPCWQTPFDVIVPSAAGRNSENLSALSVNVVQAWGIPVRANKM